MLTVCRDIISVGMNMRIPDFNRAIFPNLSVNVQ